MQNITTGRNDTGYVPTLTGAEEVTHYATGYVANEPQFDSVKEAGEQIIRVVNHATDQSSNSGSGDSSSNTAEQPSNANTDSTQAVRIELDEFVAKSQVTINATVSQLSTMRQMVEDYSTSVDIMLDNQEEPWNAAIEATGVDESTATGVILQKLQNDPLSAGVVTATVLEAMAASSSSGGLPKDILDIIRNTKGNYLDVFARLMEQYGAFFKEVGELIALLGEKDIIKVIDDKTVEIDAKKIREKIKSILDKFDKYTGTPLAIIKGGSDAARAEAERVAKMLGLDPSKCVVAVTELIPGQGYVVTSYRVVIDVSPLQNMYNALKTQPDLWRRANTEYQSWLTGVKSQESAIQTGTSLATEAFGRAYTKFDGLVKTLSSIMASLYDTLKNLLP